MPHLHWVHRLLALTILTTFVLTPPSVQAQTGPAAAVAGNAAAAGSFAHGYVWSRWGAEQAAVILDGDDLWIGGGGLLRWNSVTNTYRRYTTIDGLPSYRIYAIAVNDLGNRWFGGDGGLSRLDAAEQWTHFTPANSGLYTNSVVGIAVGADGTLWLSHRAAGPAASAAATLTAVGTGRPAAQQPSALTTRPLSRRRTRIRSGPLPKWRGLGQLCRLRWRPVAGSHAARPQRRVAGSDGSPRRRAMGFAARHLQSSTGTAPVGRRWTPSSSMAPRSLRPR